MEKLKILRKIIGKNDKNDARPWLCDICPKAFKQKHTLRGHMQKHREKRFVCNVCDYRSSVKALLKQHIVMHAPQEFCKICNRHVTSLERHMRTHKREACPICKKMHSSNNLATHMKIHDRREKFKCKDCHSTFSMNEELKR